MAVARSGLEMNGRRVTGIETWVDQPGKRIRRVSSNGLTGKMSLRRGGGK